MVNWDLAIDRNREALLRIVAALYFYAGLDEGGADVVPRRVWRMILRLLRPAESAVRRLIVIAARGIEVEVPERRAERAPTGIKRLQAAGLLVIRKGVNLGLARAPRPQAVAPRIPAFSLTDPPRRFDAKSWDGLRTFPRDGFALADPDEEVSARHLCRRLQALKRALTDIDGQARRLARWKARRDAGWLRSPRFSPMRPGWPPGHHKRSLHEVDGILRDLHSLAVYARKLDTG